MRAWRECLMALLLNLVFAPCSAAKNTGDSCGSKEKFVPGGEPMEPICNPPWSERRLNCLQWEVSQIVIKTTENGACHCADGLYRHSSGSCLTLKECGYSFDKSPCAANQRTIFYHNDMRCDGGEHFKRTIIKEPKTIYCLCPDGQHQLDLITCVDECKNTLRILPYPKLISPHRRPTTTTTPFPILDHCGNNEKLVVGGEPKEQICDTVWVKCVKKRYVEVHRTKNGGVCHCADGRFRHSNGSCLTLRECGFNIDKTPCLPHERTVLSNTYEHSLDDQQNVFHAYPKDIYCHCPKGLIRYEGKCVTDCKKDARLPYPVGSCKEPEYFDFTTTVHRAMLSSHASNSSSSSPTSTTKPTTSLTANETTPQNAAIHQLNDKTNKMNTTQSQQPSLPRSQNSQTLKPTQRKPPTSTTKSTTKSTTTKSTTTTTTTTTIQLTNTRPQTHAFLNENTNKSNAWIFASVGLGALAAFGASLVIVRCICKKRSKRAEALRATHGKCYFMNPAYYCL